MGQYNPENHESSQDKQSLKICGFFYEPKSGHFAHCGLPFDFQLIMVLEDLKMAQQPSQGSFSNRRTRSASRERNLVKIKFCWRCHQTGHESFDCTAELQPANWCPRCLESSHWEDSCWVNEQEVFCNICTLPGHLPCVHQTNDFRQRKLVIETFGWLAFKEWFREPEFWSWWNCSGFTNVPLYKLMQHRPHIASPDLQEISE